MKIAVIGGGAAGFYGAITAASSDKSLDITVFEATGEVLDKVRISGGGRCNVTHNCIDINELINNYPRGKKELLGAFSRFQPKDIIFWFKNQGVRLKTESDGRMFPVTDKASTIIDCLKNCAERLNIKIKYNARIKSIYKSRHLFEVFGNDKSSGKYDTILLTTGSSPVGYRIAKSLGHNIVPPVPSLFTFKIDDRRLDGLSGVAFENVELSLVLKSKKNPKQRGPLLITHWGLSGPSVLRLSAWQARQLHDLKYKAELIIDFVPDMTNELLYQKFASYKDQNGKKQISSGNPALLPKRYWKKILDRLNIDQNGSWKDISKKRVNLIISELKSSRFIIKGKGIFKEEFVTCGGVNLKEVNFKNMESKLCGGLFFGGEVLDIDGITGGFNFQSAWTTGWLAGKSMGNLQPIE